MFIEILERGVGRGRGRGRGKIFCTPALLPACCVC